MKVIESHRQDTRQFAVILTPGVFVLVISDFPSSIYAKFYLTKRKSVKNAPDSSLKLISYSPIFASHFWIVVALVILSLTSRTKQETDFLH